MRILFLVRRRQAHLLQQFVDAVANGTVGRVSMSGSLPSIAMRDKEEAYGEVVSQLVTDVTHDLRPTWVKQ